MRIGIDARLIHTLKTGSAHYACNLLRAFAQIDRQNRYLLFTSGNSSTQRLIDQHNFVEVKSPAATLMNPTWEQLQSPGLLAAHRVDVFFSLTLVLPIMSRVPSVMVLYDVGFELFPQYYVPELLDYLKRWVPRSVVKADAVIAISERTKRDAITEYAKCGPTNGSPVSPTTAAIQLEQKIHVIYPAVSESFGLVADRNAVNAVAAKYGLPGEYALTVCSLEENKNLAAVLTAFAKLKAHASGLTLKFAMVGRPGQAVPRLKRTIAELGLEGHVVFTGYVPDDDLPALYNGAVMFVSPSLYEGFGLPPLEAMSCGTPVITSDRTSLPEVVGDAALIVNPQNTDEIASAMQRLIDDASLRSKLRGRGLERAKQFSWQTTAEQILKVLKRVAQRAS